MDLTCEDNKCLICGSDLYVNSGDVVTIKSCSNTCIVVYIRHGHLTTMIIYKIIYSANKTKEMIDKINYWKENERYLTKILDGSK